MLTGEYNHLHISVSALTILDVKNLFMYLLPSELLAKCVQFIVNS